MTGPPETPVYEHHLDGQGVGWRGWRIEISSEEGQAAYSWDERDGCGSPDEAVRLSLLSFGLEGRRIDTVEIEATEMRVLVSAEICPN